MKRSILLLGFLTAFSQTLFAADDTFVLQKDIVSHTWIQQEALTKSVNPGVFTRLMTAYTAVQLLEQTKNDAAANKEEKHLDSLAKMSRALLLSLDQKEYGQLLKAFDVDDQTFVAAMNKDAETLGMKDTHFVSVFATNDRKHRTTPQDIATLSEAVFNHPLLRDAPTSLNEAILDSQNGRRNFDAQILQTPFAFGGRLDEGWSATFVSENAYDNGRIRRMVSIVLNADSVEDLTDHAAQVIKDGFTSYETLPLYTRGETVGNIFIAHGNIRKLPVYVNSDTCVTIKKSELVNNSTEAFKILISHASPLKAPIAKDEEVGKMTVYLHGQVLRETPVFAKTAVETGNFWRRFTDTVRYALNSQETKDNK